MNSFRFIHAADLHLDSPFKGLQDLPKGILTTVRESTLKAFDRLIDLCILNEVDFLLIAGDVYDAVDRSLRAQMKFQQGMNRLAEKGIHAFIIHGNHDPMDGYRAILRWPEEVHFMAADRVERIPFYKDGQEVARIYGRSYPTRVVTENFVTDYVKEADAPFTIGLLHTNVDGDTNHDNYAPCRAMELINSGIDYWALGHIHTRNVKQVRETTIVYPGNIQGRSVRETGPRGCYLVDVASNGSISTEFIETDVVRWEQVSLSIDLLNNEQDLFDLLEETKEEIRRVAQGRPVIMRLTLTGRGPIHQMLHEAPKMMMINEYVTENEAVRSDFVWIESIVVRTGKRIDREQLLREEHILSDLLRYSQQLGIDRAAYQQVIEQALTPLLDHGRTSRHLGGVNDSELIEWMKDAEELAIHHLIGSGGDVDED